MRKFMVFFGALLLVACSMETVRNPEATLPVEGIVLVGPAGKIRLQAEIADEQAEWQVGLMNRYLLPDGTGMLFVFPNEIERAFWMRNTLIPLDIIFFDGEGKFVSAFTMHPCKKDPCRMYGSNGIATSALEVPAGFVQQHGIGEGWKIEF